MRSQVLITKWNHYLNALTRCPALKRRSLRFCRKTFFFLQKELPSKDEIIKKLIETQTSIHESVSFQKLKNESNELVNQFESAHQFSNEMNSSKSPSSPHLLNRTPNYHQDVKTNTSGAIKNSYEINKNVPKPKNLQSQTRNKKQTNVGNRNNDLNIKDLTKLSGLETTKYLKENCSITMSINRKTAKNKGIAFVLSPDHVHNELLKLNGIEFHGKSSVLEKAMSPGKKSEKQLQRQYHKRPQVIVNNSSENQDTFKKPDVMSGNSKSKNEGT